MIARADFERELDTDVLKIAKRAAGAATVMICHTFVGGVTVLCMSALQWLFWELGGGKAVLVYDRWPLEYLFQTIDIAIALVVGAFGLWETIEVLRGGRDSDE